MLDGFKYNLKPQSEVSRKIIVLYFFMSYSQVTCVLTIDISHEE